MPLNQLTDVQTTDITAASLSLGLMFPPILTKSNCIKLNLDLFYAQKNRCMHERIQKGCEMGIRSDTGC